MSRCIGFKNKSNGKVGVVPFPLNGKSTNLHRHAFFVPLMYEIAFHSSGSKRPLFYRTKSKMVDLPLKDIVDVVELTDGEKVILAQKRKAVYQLGSKIQSGVYYLNDKLEKPVLAINHELNWF